MRILFVTPQLPWPARQGTALRNFHLLQAAAGAHTVDLLSFDESGTGGGDAPRAIDRLGPLRDLCRRVEAVPVPRRRRHARLRDLLLGWADMERRLWSPAFQSLLAARLASEAYDAVQLEGFEVAGYLLGPSALRAEALGRAPWQRHPSGGAHGPDGGRGGAGQARRGLAPRLIFDDHNAEYQLQDSAWRIDGRRPQRWLRAVYSALQARRLRAREALYCAAADACLAVSEEDAAALEAVVPGLGAVVVPNGVDVGAMPPATPGAEPEIFFAGKLDYRPNVDACEWLVREILPRVQAEVPAARVVLAGRDPAPEVRALAGPAVEVTGALSDAALASRRAAAWVAVVPTRMGSGVRFKALEAMAAGVPLVATPLGAAGSGAVDGEHALIAEDGASFAAAVVCL
ncbi:MAG TPA: glycosyltransferase family 4 protein, partial [Chloroflexota bacterium]|nr:glycosyltransferase family 4 protein [Chloroflexota bacterium]